MEMEKFELHIRRKQNVQTQRTSQIKPEEKIFRKLPIVHYCSIPN